MNKKIIALAVAAVLSVTTLVGGSMAYFTATDSTSTDFTVGTVDVSIVEAADKAGKDLYANGDLSSALEYIVPGQSVPYYASIKNEGTVDVYVRAVMKVVNFNAAPALDAYQSIGANAKYEIAKDLDAKTATITFKAPVAAGTSTIPFTTMITIPYRATATWFSTLDQGFDIEVQAIQAAGFDSAEAAFAAYDA